MSVRFAAASEPALPLHLVASADLARWLTTRTEAEAAWLAGCGMDARTRGPVLLPDARGRLAGAVALLPSPEQAGRERFALAALRRDLPAGCWWLNDGGALSPAERAEAALGWLLEGYRFGRYKAAKGGGDGRADAVRLVAPEGVDAARIEAIAASEALARDLVNTPASDLGPAELEAAARALATEFGARLAVTTGADLLAANLPLIHAVGRASPREPRLIALDWGASGPLVALVGKGVCFDTGGLDLKPATSMGLMKKDMGGAASVLALARTIMALRLPLRLRVLIPAVENSVAGNAFRPQDILTSRKGLTVEVNNTDAEGRLVLADALALADEARPDLIVSMATLTGAARVALGPDIAPFYATDEGDALAVARAGAEVADPVWRLPFHPPYEALIEPEHADLDNAPSGGMAGSITAALFLRRFVTACPRYLHFDIYAWQPRAAPGRPKGGVGQGWRALLHALPQMAGS